jgi:hypothetical protein
MASTADKADREISAEELSSWWTPHQSASYGTTCQGISDMKSAYNAIWQRLVGGLIEAAAASWSATPAKGSPVPHMTPDFVPLRYWRDFTNSGSDIWGAGDARFYVVYQGGSTTYRYFGIRLNPADVRKVLPAVRPPPPKQLVVTPKQETAEPTKIEPTEPTQKGPRVPDPHLKAWFDFYKAIHSSIEDTEDRALEHARQCFPGKSVSRDRVRALRGSVKRGPKAKHV